MNRIFNVTGGEGGNAFLIVGDNYSALVDCGMSYCASELIRNIKQVLNSKALDYALISHSHYDHVGGVPYLREEWPNMSVCGTEYDKKVLNRTNALNSIKELNIQAANIYSNGNFKDYKNDLMKIDTIITDGDIIKLGKSNILVVETPGHTKHTLSFLVNDKILFASESTGYMSQSGKIYPAFLISYSKTMASIDRCKEINPERIISPHFGLVNISKTMNYWEECIVSAVKSRDFILHLFKLGYGEDQILLEYEKKFQDKQSRLEQPVNAFRLNTQSMIKSVLHNSEH